MKKYLLMVVILVMLIGTGCSGITKTTTYTGYSNGKVQEKTYNVVEEVTTTTTVTETR